MMSAKGLKSDKKDKQKERNSSHNQIYQILRLTNNMNVLLILCQANFLISGVSYSPNHPFGFTIFHISLHYTTFHF